MEKKSNLRLNLKGKWYDMIDSGFKKEEYREIKEYWQKRLMNLNMLGYCDWCNGKFKSNLFKHYDTVTFVYGYTKRTMTFNIEEITIGRGKTEWGGLTDKDVFIIKLGERIE